MAQQNINQYAYPKLKISFALDASDMSLSSDEVDYNQEVVFSPYLIAQTYGNRLPVYYDLNSSNTTQNLTLTYGQYDYRNLVVSENYYNPDNLDLTCFSAQSACDIGLVGMDNGLVTSLVGQTITFTNGLFNQTEKFQRTYFDRRMKMFQVTGYTSQYNRFSGIPKNTLYEIESTVDPNVGKYHKLYGGFYQGFYKLFGYDYEALPERTNKGWSVEMVLKPRIINDRIPSLGNTTLNEIYPENKNTFFYLGTRAENKFYHHADGHPKCFTGYTRVTSGLTDCLVTCACCNTGVTNSRCIFVYPPRSVDGIHDYHINYGCDVCKEQKRYCGCDCGEEPCGTCGWECKTHPCALITGVTPTPMPIVPLLCKPCQPTPTPTPTPTPSPVYCEVTPPCDAPCPDCDTCDECIDCITCATTGYTSIEDTCEKDPLWDSLSNAFSVKFSGDPKNPKICVKVLRFTGDCVTTGSCATTGITQMTGYTIDTYCSPNGIYDYCLTRCDSFFDLEKWMLIDVVWRRYTWLDTCDLQWRGGLGDITELKYLDSLVNDTTKLIKPPYTHENCSIDPEQIELVKLNQKWLNDLEYRMGRLKIYVNGKPFFTIENFEEVIPRALDTDKERQIGVPFNMSWGGGTQGLHENLIFSSCTLPYTDYIQDPELFPENVLSGTTFAGMKTNILLEQNFGGTFEGGISQFRMYVDPLTAPEIKHNFKILKDKFSMFDPDCPDCNPIECKTNDFKFPVCDIDYEIIPGSTPSPTPTPTSNSCCVVNYEAPLPNSSVIINGITITGSGTGRITPFSTSVPVAATCETNLITYTNTVELGDDSPPYTGPTNFIYTMTFSSPVNNLLIHLIDYTTPETFTITTNTAIPSIVPCDGCCYNITNNLITVGPPGTGCRNLSPSTFGGSGQFTIAAATSYTTVTISGPGGGGGTLLKICDLNLTPPTPTPTATPSCFIDDCASCGPSYSAYNETTCYSISSIPATPPSNPYTLVPKSYISYSGFGTYVYNPGYNVSGYTNSITDGLYTIINTPFLWKNTTSSYTSGPLNRCGLWVNGSGQPENTWVGFSVCLDVLTTKTYYIGIAGDNHFKLTLDGNVIVNTRLAISQWYGSNYPFTRWNVYPITINSGPHILELFGWNNESFASFGCEIYDNTLNELITATTLSDLNIIFTSSGITSANVIQNSYDEYLDTGFSCPDGYVYNHCTNTCEFFSFCYTCPDPTPTVTPGLSPTPTPTVTPGLSPTPLPIISTCSVLINNGSDVYAYFPSSNTNVFLGNSFASSLDIAHTTTKLWMWENGTSSITEYDITLSPWSATFNRFISFPSGVNLGYGLGSITNTQLISTNDSVSPHQIIVLDITTNTAVSTVIGTLGVGRVVSGDILLTTTNKILVTNCEGTTGSTYLTQYSYPSGTFEVEVDITSTTPSAFGIFIDSGNIYVCNSGGQIYNVNVNFPYTQTLFNNSGLGIGGASQEPSCCNVNLII